MNRNQSYDEKMNAKIQRNEKENEAIRKSNDQVEFQFGKRAFEQMINNF